MRGNGEFDLNLFSRATPSFGNWCGPNWSAGFFGKSASRDELIAATVAKIPGPDGVLRDSSLDAICKEHDITYLEPIPIGRDARRSDHTQSAALPDRCRRAFPADQQAPVAIEPAMRAFDDPASRPRSLTLGLVLVPTTSNPRHHADLPDMLIDPATDITQVQTQPRAR